jgi:hypothetical protein
MSFKLLCQEKASMAMSYSLASTLVRIRLMFPAEIFGLSALLTLSHVFLRAIPSAPLSHCWITETPIKVRDKRDKESRLKLMTVNCPTKFTGKISYLLCFLGLGFLVELSSYRLIASGVDSGHVLVKRPCGMGKCPVGIARRNHVNNGIVVLE